MMGSLTRTDRSVISHWWWTVDRWLVAAVIALMAIGAVFIMAASPAAAERIGLSSFQLATRHLVILPVGLALCIGVSLLPVAWVRRFALLGVVASLGLLSVTLVVGAEIKGATRWIAFGGFSLQPSEFVKPCLAVTIAWLLAAERREGNIPGTAIALALTLVVVALLLMQPDLGQAFLVGVIWAAEMFLVGVPLIWVAGLAVAGAAGIVGAYFSLPHVAARINSFLDPTAGDHYQVNRSIEAFMNGGLFGRGPGEGTVKAQLPDAHSDFIFAVAGEEFGLFVCLIVVALFAFVVLRSFLRVLDEPSLFVLLAVGGLVVQFGAQALINIGSTLHLIPTKGMTLPLISYGGSSLLAIALGMGMVLALTRRRPGTGWQS